MNVESKKLVGILRSLLPAVASKDIVEQNVCFAFCGSHILTGNDIIGISQPLETDFKCLVRAQEFFDVIKEVTSESLDLTVDGPELLLKSDDTEAGFTLLMGENSELAQLDIPEIPEDGWQDLPSNFMEGLGFCQFSAAKAATEGSLTCLFINGKQIVSSDNFRISQYDLDKDLKTSFLLILPYVQALIDFKPVSFCKGEGVVHFRNDGDSLFSYNLYMDQEYDTAAAEVAFQGMDEGEVVVFPPELQESLKASLVLVEGSHDLDKVVTIKLKKGMLEVEGKKDTGWIKKRLKTDFDGNPFEFDINPVFLVGVLDKTDRFTHSTELHRALMSSPNFKHVMALPM